MSLVCQTAFEKAKEVLPGGVSSPLRSFRKVEAKPFVTKRACKDQIFDTDNNSYMDFCMGNGALILGHCPEKHREVLQKATQDGILYGTTTEEEEKLARLISSHFTSIDKVRFFPSGTEATMTAIRLARAYTQRKKIVKFSGCYHGHADMLLVQAGSEAGDVQPISSGITSGQTEDTFVLPFNDEKALLELFQREKELAAVILEPICANMGLVPATKEFLQTLRRLTRENGSVLIFDEVVTGYRLGLQGAQGYYQVEADLTCFGKIIGGGIPCGALGGRKEILDLFAPLGPVFHAGTFASHPLAMKLGLATLQTLSEPNFYEDLEGKSQSFLEPVQKILAKKKHSLVRIGSMFAFFFGIYPPSSLAEVNGQDVFLFKKLFHHLYSKGVFFHPSYYETHFISSAHSESHLQYVQELLCDFAKSLS